jgi:hypothetical protein
VVLYVYVIQGRQSPPDKYLQIYQTAIKCQSQISSSAIPGSLAERYGLILQELRNELLRHNSYLLSLEPQALQAQAAEIGSGLRGPGGRSILAGQQEGGARPEALPDDLEIGNIDSGNVETLRPIFAEGVAEFTEMSPSSSIAELLGWGQFDSLVSSNQASAKLLK